MQINHIKNKILLIILLIELIILITGCSSNTDIQLNGIGYIKGMVHIPGINPVIENDDINIKGNNEEKNIDLNIIPMETAIFKPDEYIIKFNEVYTVNYINNQLLKGKGRVIQKLDNKYTYKIKINKGILNDLINSPYISYIEPDYMVQIQTIPNDTEYYKQWNLKMLGLESTWETNKGSDKVIVAVIDTGILPDHPDLKKNIIEGYDFIDNDSNPTDTSPGFSHGTHIAGIIGAITNNNQGIAAINWNVKIMPVRVIGPEGSGGYSTLISGIRWAVDNGANVINLSLAGTADSNSLKDSIDYAIENNVSVIAAAGNNGSTPILYPAQYPEVISVGAVGPTKLKAYYSNYGPNLDLVAPGGDSSIYSENYNTILSTAGYMNLNGQITHQYNWAQGTSMATPHVTGIVALLYSVGINDPIFIEQLLKDTADDLGQPGKDYEYGAGLVNINAALNIPELSINIESVKVFIISEEEEFIIENTPNISPEKDGKFILQAPPGKWSIIGWIDINNNQTIDPGDYYDKIDNIQVESNVITENINLYLEKYRN
jgi:serine protease